MDRETITFRGTPGNPDPEYVPCCRGLGVVRTRGRRGQEMKNILANTARGGALLVLLLLVLPILGASVVKTPALLQGARAEAATCGFAVYTFAGGSVCSDTWMG